MCIAPGEQSTFGPIWLRKGPKPLQNFKGFLSVVALNRSKAQATDLQKLHWKHPSSNSYFMSNLYFEICQFTGKSMKDQTSTFASFDRLLFLTPTDFVSLIGSKNSPVNRNALAFCGEALPTL